MLQLKYKSVRELNQTGDFMKIIRLAGQDARLYELVAPLVMSAPVLRENNNYPYKTSRRHVWLLAIDDNTVQGFVPIEVKDEQAIVNNYYVSGNDSEILSALLQETVRLFGSDRALLSVTQTKHIPVFEKEGFHTIRMWKKYAKMEYGENEKGEKCL